MTSKLIATGIASIVLTGCVALSTPELEQSWQGRFSLIARSASQQENHSGRFTLTQANTDLTILDLKSALGNTLARITQTPTEVSLETLGNPTVYANDAESLLLKSLGFSVPVDGLNYWIDGKVIPNQAASTIPSAPPYNQVKQSGWLITYENYDESGLPKRIRLTRKATSFAPSISILLVVSSRDHDS